MRIALFDIDGTLTASNAIDSECRAAAFHDVFGFTIHTNWIQYNTSPIAASPRRRSSRNIIEDRPRKNYRVIEHVAFTFSNEG